MFFIVFIRLDISLFSLKNNSPILLLFSPDLLRNYSSLGEKNHSFYRTLVYHHYKSVFKTYMVFRDLTCDNLPILQLKILLKWCFLFLHYPCIHRCQTHCVYKILFNTRGVNKPLLVTLLFLYV